MNALNAKELSDSARRQKLLEVQRAAQASTGLDSPALAARSPEAESAEQKGVAGRKRMKGGGKWDMATGKESALPGSHAGGAKEEKAQVVETEEEHEVEVELNSILKKGPSKSNRVPV